MRGTSGREFIAFDEKERRQGDNGTYRGTTGYSKLKTDVIVKEEKQKGLIMFSAHMKEILISQYLVCNKHLKVHTYIFNALRNNKNTTLPPIA